jgi:hypothetical protein
MSRLEGCRRCDDVGRCVGVRGGDDIALASMAKANRSAQPLQFRLCRGAEGRQIAIEGPVGGPRVVIV